MSLSSSLLLLLLFCLLFWGKYTLWLLFIQETIVHVLVISGTRLIIIYYFQNLPLYPKAEIHNYATRKQHNIHQPKTNYEYDKLCVWYDVSNVINCSPSDILERIDTHSLQGFSEYIKKYILQSHQEHYTLINCYFCNKWITLLNLCIIIGYFSFLKLLRPFEISDSIITWLQISFCVMYIILS